MRQYTAFAFGIPYDINGFHPYTISSVHLSHSLSITVSNAFPKLGLGLSQKTNNATYTPFTPNNSG